MATTSARILQLLSLLEARHFWTGADLAARLEVSSRTLRRDVDTLRQLGYPVDAIMGPDGGYRLGAGSKLPPLVLDDDQAIAIALALQTAPATVTGIDDAVARALTTLRQVMPARLRAASEAFELTALRNYWEFAAPPISVATLQAVGAAIRTMTVLRFDYVDSPDSADRRTGTLPRPLSVQPHRLVVWAGRWYLVSWDPDAATWVIHRVDRMRPLAPSGRRFEPRELSTAELNTFVTQTADRGDTVPGWQCVGSAVLDLPPSVVARWAPGGSKVDAIDDDHSRLTIGAWSWMGVAGLLITFDATISEPCPRELADALDRLRMRLSSESNLTPARSAGA